ncbi:MAG: glycosyltransferase [Microthrixaceae bacterium]
MSRPSCLIYDLYLDTLGGGERVILEAAAALATDHDVTIAAPRLPSRDRLAALGMATEVPLRRLHPSLFPLASARADLAVYLANGVPLPSLARRSLLIVQFPFGSLSRMPGLRSLQRAALRRYSVLAYSEFAAHWTRVRLGVEPTVLHPPARLGSHDPDRKEHLILSVGRFFASQHTKRHDVLIDAYRRLSPTVRQDWSLVLAGGLYGGSGGAAYLDRLREMADGSNIRFEVDASEERMRDLFARATLFWHATGFGRSPHEPERAEHFGLSTVEAMSWGAIPLVYADGGQPEIVDSGSGVLWQSVDELCRATEVLAADSLSRTEMARSAAQRAAGFQPEVFRRAIRRLAAAPAG